MTTTPGTGDAPEERGWDRRRTVGAVIGGVIVAAVIAMLVVGLANKDIGTSIQDALEEGKRPNAPDATLPVLLSADLAWLGTGRGWAVVLWLGLVATALSYVMFSHGLGATPVAAAATLTLAEPLTAAVLGMVVLDEPVRATTIVGIGLVGLGLVALTVRGGGPPGLRSEI